MAMKKWKICVGICGPTLLWTNVIKAYTAEEAVKKYLEETDGKVDQDEFDFLLKHCHEHIPQKRASKAVDN